jgi:hypothetical protein
MTNEQITADADLAAKYLKALQASGIPNSDAITMANSYMGSVIMARAYAPQPPAPAFRIGKNPS